MDKKPSARTTQIQSKTPGDCKKLDNFKPFPRNNRKRESPNENKPKADNHNRKNVGFARAKGRGDRRASKTSTLPESCVASRSEETGLENLEPELGSVFIPGSKKHNAQHLLNFMYHAPQRGSSAAQHGNTYNRQRGGYNKHPVRALNRDMFLQANCQFVVDENGDYTKQMFDPDLPVPWDLIFQVVIRSEECGSCPVCLSTPVSARVTRCGHVYCWPCILHYLNVCNDNKTPPCPVCHQPIAAEQLKSARVEVRTHSTNITMVRVRRLRGSLNVATHCSSVDEETDQLPALADEPQPFARLLTASRAQLKEIYERDRQELREQIMNEFDTSEIVYIEQALALLDKECAKLDAVPSVNQPSPIETDPKQDIIVEKTEFWSEKYDWFDVKEGENITWEMNKVTIGGGNIDMSSELKLEEPVEGSSTEVGKVGDCLFDCELEQPDLKVQQSNDRSKYFYFYQAEDGSPIFLHGLNVRLLQASWGDLTKAPNKFTATILHATSNSVTEETRKRAPYTTHLPLHTMYELVELDLKPPTVTADALYMYKEELLKRDRSRRAEKRRPQQKQQLDEYKNLLSQYYGTPHDQYYAPDTTSAVEFPAALVNVSEAASFSAGESSVTQSAAGPSFAKMASTSGTWRVRPSQPPQPSKPVTTNIANLDENFEESRSPPTLSLSDAIAAALIAPKTKGNKKKRKK